MEKHPLFPEKSKLHQRGTNAKLLDHSTFLLVEALEHTMKILINLISLLFFSFKKNLITKLCILNTIQVIWGKTDKEEVKLCIKNTIFQSSKLK